MAMTATQRTEIVKAVVGLFNAAPGATYLNELVSFAGNPASLVDGLVQTSAFQSIYPTFLTNAEFSSKFIGNLVGGAVAQAELDWAVEWFTGLLNGGASRGEAAFEAITALNAVPATDTNWGAAKKQFDNKAVVAEYYSVDMAQAVTDLSVLTSVVSGVTADTDVSDPATIAAVVEEQVTPVATPGQTFTLTTALGENVVGTAGNDLFTAVLEGAGSGAASNGGTLNIGDVINGGAGTDTLTVTVVDGKNGLPAGATLTSVEIVNLNNTNTADAFHTGTIGFVDASKFAGVEQLWQAGFATVDGAKDHFVTNLAATQTAGFRGITVDAAGALDLLTVTAADTAKSVSVALDGVKGIAAGVSQNSIALDVGGKAVDTVTIAGTIAQNATAAGSLAAKLVTTATVAQSAETVTLSTAVKTDLTFALDATGAAAKDVKVLDLSGSTGDVTLAALPVAAGGFANVETIKLGSGKDVFTVGMTGKDTTVDAGAGNDTITTTLTGATEMTTVTGGAGNDIFGFNSTTGNVAAGVTNTTELLATVAKIADFTTGQDVVKGVDTLNDFASQTVVNGLVDGKASLFDAVTALAANGDVGAQWTQFVFDGNLYLYNSTAATIADADSLIELSGVTTLLVSADLIA